jgi:hypothetical protein
MISTKKHAIAPFAPPHSLAMPTNSSPSTWTLRFKQHRSTFLLHTDPLQSFSAVKKELLIALSETNPSGIFNDQSIPKNADDILFAKPVDINDLNAGWELLQLNDREEASGKGKGKAGATAKAGGKVSNQLKDCPQGAGLRDGSVVAFKFRSAEDDQRQNTGQEGEDDEIVVAEEDMKRVEQWDVIVPTMEESYGEQPLGEAVGDEGTGL